MTEEQRPEVGNGSGPGHKPQNPPPHTYPPQAFGLPSFPPQVQPVKNRWKVYFSAAAVVLLAVTSVLIGVVVANQSPEGQVDESQLAPSSPSLPGMPSAGSEPAASVCGLAGLDAEGKLISAGPDASWSYQGELAYPVSATAGPAMTSPSGYRYCFQHTSEGAVFAAANAAGNGSTDDPEMMREWLDYVLADGRYREELLRKGSTPVPPDESDAHVGLVGFRLLSYSASEARVELAYITTGDLLTYGYASVTYTLVWQDGDWLVGTDTDNTIQYRAIYDSSGFVEWFDPATVKRYTVPIPEGAR